MVFSFRWVVFLLCPLVPCVGQQLLNGDFENNTGFCIINGSNTVITNNLFNAVAYGIGNEIDLMNNTCGYGTAYSGNYFICLANSSGFSPDGITLALNAPLVAGNTYTLYYYDRGYDVFGCCPPGVPLEVGISTVPGTQGTVVYTSPVPTLNVWSLRVVTFVAPNNGQYISFQAQNNNMRWTHIDCVSLTVSSCCATFSTSFNVVDATCGQNNGMAIATVSGTTGPYSFVWNTLPVQTNDTAFGLAPGTYSVIITDALGCSVIDSVSVGNLNVVNLDIVPASVQICAGDSVLLTASGAASYSWQPAATLSSATDSMVWAFPNSTTTYVLTGWYLNCVGYDSVTVVVQPVPQVGLDVSPQQVCVGDTVTVSFSGSAGPGATFNWEFGSANVVSGGGAGPYELVWSGAGTYQVLLVVSENGCLSQPAVQQVEVHAMPQVFLYVSDTLVCAGQYVQALAYGNISASLTLDWNFWGATVVSGSGAGPYLLKYPSAGTYLVSLQIAQGACSLLRTQSIEVAALPVAQFAVSDTAGCSLLEVVFENQSMGATTFQWQFGDGTYDTVPSPVHLYDEGWWTVQLIAQNSIGCSDTVTYPKLIHVYGWPVAAFSVDPPANQPVFLDDALFVFTNLSKGATGWHWDFGDGGHSDAFSPQYRYNQPGEYIVVLVAYNEGGCTDTAQLAFLLVEHNPGIIVPTAFTPNGDGINDQLHVYAFHIASFRMQIFNRWGQLVFSSSNLHDRWDGRIQGVEAEVGAYVWVIEAFTVDQRVLRLKGNVTVLR